MIEQGLTFDQLSPRDQKDLEGQYQGIDTPEPQDKLGAFGQILLDRGFTPVGVVFELKERAKNEAARQTDDAARRVYEKAEIFYGQQIKNATMYGDTPQIVEEHRDLSQVRGLHGNIGGGWRPDGGGSGGRSQRNKNTLKNR